MPTNALLMSEFPYSLTMLRLTMFVVFASVVYPSELYPITRHGIFENVEATKAIFKKEKNLVSYIRSIRGNIMSASMTIHRTVNESRRYSSAFDSNIELYFLVATKQAYILVITRN